MAKRKTLAIMYYPSSKRVHISVPPKLLGLIGDIELDGAKKSLLGTAIITTYKALCWHLPEEINDTTLISALDWMAEAWDTNRNSVAKFCIMFHLGTVHVEDGYKGQPKIQEVSR